MFKINRSKSFGGLARYIENEFDACGMQESTPSGTQ